MNIELTDLPGVVTLTPRRFSDARGWFTESWNSKTLSDAGFDLPFVQDNHSYSERKGTLRGLHYQSPPHAQDKLVRCTQGSVLDVAVDFRIGSPYFGKWIAVELSAQNGKQILVPAGFLHGFLTLEDQTEVQYKCTDLYSPVCEANIRWNDPDLGIDWGLGETEPMLSDKDVVAPFLAQITSPFTLEGAS